jgi:hypothetical protein
VEADALDGRGNGEEKWGREKEAAEKRWAAWRVIGGCGIGDSGASPPESQQAGRVRLNPIGYLSDPRIR